MKKEKFVLCCFCGKKIHIDEWGGLRKGEKDNEEFFHTKCFLNNKLKSAKDSIGYI